MRRLKVLLIVIVAFLAVEELLLPAAVGAMVARGMRNVTGTEDVSAEVQRRPALLMLGGNFDQVRIEAHNAKVDKIAFAELDTRLTNVQLDVMPLLTKRSMVIKSVKDVDLTAVITQEELSRYLSTSVKGIKNATVKIAGGKVQVNGSVALGPIASLAVTLDGKVVGDGQKLKFVTERFLLNNATVGNIGGSVLTEIQLVDLAKLPFGVAARSVTSEDGKITVRADNHGK